MKQPKYFHSTRQNVAGRFSVVADCGRLVGRLSIETPERATCPRCIAVNELRANPPIRESIAVEHMAIVHADGSECADGCDSQPLRTASE